MSSLLKTRLNIVLSTVLLLFVVSACSSSENEESVVAVVNKSPIYFVDLEAQRNMFFPGLDRLGNPPVDADLKIEYSYSLKQLIRQELVRQYLEEIKDFPSESVFQDEIENVIHDYGDDFVRDLEESGVSPSIWRNAVKRQVVVKYFIDTVLKPKIIISSEEVKSYYQEHRDEFIVPEQWHFVEMSGRDKEQVEKAQALFISSQNATEIQKNLDVIVRDIKMGKNRLPENVVKDIATLSPMKAGGVVKEDEAFLTRILLGSSPERKLEVLETYKRIESALLEDRLAEAFSLWIKKRVEKSKIKIAKKLLPFSSLDSLNKKVQANATTSTNSTEIAPEPIGISQD